MTEPLYGRRHLPRKFEIAVTLYGDNCTDVCANDPGFVALREGNRLLGYNVPVGGGVGVTPSKRGTLPAAAAPMAFVAPEEVTDLVEGGPWGPGHDDHPPSIPDSAA